MTLALPALESDPKSARAGSNRSRPRRMVCIGNIFGSYHEAFWPDGTGKGYSLAATMEPLGPHRDRMTVISGLDHGVKGGHFGIHAFLSGVRSIDAKSMPEGNTTVDQRAAETVGGETRFPSLTIGSETGIHGGRSFDGVTGLKRILAERHEFFARTLTERLLTCALGRRIEPSDRQAVDDIVASVADHEYPMRTLIEAIASGDTFRRP